MSWFRGRRRPCGDVSTRAAEKKLVEAVREEDDAERVQAAMLGEEHVPVLELEKQAAAPTFELGPPRKPSP